jgi:1,4-alpha-glucan branching enzyme
MSFRYAMSLVFEVHLPFIKEYSRENDLSQAGEEGRFFEYITETLLPLLEVLNRLKNDHIPCKLALAISPVICHLLNDEHLINKYLHYIDKQIEFGQQELKRTADNEELNKLARFYCDRIADRRTAFTEKYNRNILKAFDFFRRTGKLEILASCATNAFLPFISHNQESIQAQMEIPTTDYRAHFNGTLHGFWLPALGWTPAIEPYLRAYNYSYTIVESHGLLFGKPLPNKGTFYPVKTPDGTFIFGRDFHSLHEIEKFSCDELYRNNDRDVGYELPPEMVRQFLSTEGERHKTGYKYWRRGENGNTTYNPQPALDKAVQHARLFLENNIARLEEAAKQMKETPLCLFAHNMDNFGRLWYEGSYFIESLFRIAPGYRDFNFITPGEYIFRQGITSIQVTVPEFSSGGNNGYAEPWLNVSNDWIYRHLVRSMERMTELAERFPDETGLKERALNQAAREILFAQSSDWPLFLYKQDSTEYARVQAENALRNFTTIYEALGSSYISTEWLTTLERRHNIFPNINYRVFRRKK